VAMLLRYSFGLGKEADAVEKAVADVVAAGYRTRDIYIEGMKLVNTQEMGNAVVETLG
jgi:3-isopropylmalate dehydrogenase